MILPTDDMYTNKLLMIIHRLGCQYNGREGSITLLLSFRENCDIMYTIPQGTIHDLGQYKLSLYNMLISDGAGDANYILGLASGSKNTDISIS